MTEWLTPDQVRERNIAAMGRELGELFTALSSEFTWVCLRWMQYSELFGDKQNRYELMNQAAGFFFFLVQTTFFDDTLLGITRLTGPSITMGHDNLTMRRLPPPIGDASVKAEVSERIERLVAKAEFATIWRNQHIAHRDLALALGNAAESLPPATRKEVDEIIDDMAGVLNAVEKHYFRSETAYRHSPALGDAVNLLHVVRDGLRREELRQKRLEHGEYDPVDWDEAAPPI